MRNKVRTLALATVFALGASAANAVTIEADVDLNAGVTYRTDGISEDIVLGNDMLGMIVRAYYLVGPTLATSDYEEATWQDFTLSGAPNDGIAGYLTAGGELDATVNGRAQASWYLYLSGNQATIEAIWHLHNRTADPIVALELIAREGDATFDVWPFNPIEGTLSATDHDTDEGTLNSNDGNAFRNKFYNAAASVCPDYIANTPKEDIAQCADTNDPAFSGDEILDVDYYDQLVLGPVGGPFSVFAGDEYTRLFINIPNGGLHAHIFEENPNMGYELAFRADTDLATSEIGETTVETPEPMTIALFGAGLLGLGALRRFRRKAGK